MSKPSLLLIINPKAGHSKAPAIVDYIDESGIREIYNVETAFTERRAHATALSKQAVQSGFKVVVAAGGDGTVNETASSLVNTDTALAIIAAGSGNGLARHLGYPLNPLMALKKIKDGKVDVIDTLTVNERFALNVSGFGFDGYVAWLFDQDGRRGLISYTRIALKEYFRYEKIKFNVLLDNEQFDVDAHMVVIANASQFGNAAIIAPLADLRDGLTDIIIVNRPPLHMMPITFYRLFNGKLRSNKYTRMLTGKKLSLTTSHPVHLHIDGEPCISVTQVEVLVKPRSLKIIV